MIKLGKWLGGGLGWVISGMSPVGAILGFAVGAVVDANMGKKSSPFRQHTTPGDFSASLLVLTAVVMKADGKIMRSELNYVKQFFLRQFSEEFTLKQMQILKELLAKDIQVKEVCEDIRRTMELPLRLQLLHYLFGIAAADGNIDPSEVKVLQQISFYMGIRHADFSSVMAMFVKDTTSAYKVLEIDPNASDEEVKKAYRKMAVKYHPDKVATLGEEHQKSAQERFRMVQEAYESIKKERKMS